jgi:hypothetical protein
MQRAILRVIVRRTVWTLAYTAGVFLVVAALGYVEWQWETQSWVRRLSAGSAEARAEAMSQYALRVSRFPHPVPCEQLVRGLSDAPEVRREAMPAVVRVVRSGYCIRDVADALGNGSDAAVRIAAARALAFTPFRRRLEVLPLLSRAAADRDSVAAAARETLQQLDGTANGR